MAKGITVIVKTGKDIPDDYLNALVSRKDTTAFGAMYVDPDDGLKAVRLNGEVEAKGIKDFRELFRGQVVFQAMDYPKAHNLDDLQPITLLTDAKDNPTLLAMFEGDFSAHHKENSSHMPFYHVAMDEIFPKIVDTLEIIEGEEDTKLDKLVRAMKSDSFRKDMNKLITTAGSITLMAADGETWTYIKRDDPMFSFDWGTVSDPLGLDKAASKPPVEAAKGKANLKAVLSSRAAAVEMPKPKPEVSNPPPLVEPEDEDDKEANKPLPVGFEAKPGNPANWPDVDKGGPPRSYLPAEISIQKASKMIKAYKRACGGWHPPKSVLEALRGTGQDLPAYISIDNQRKWKLKALATKTTENLAAVKDVAKGVLGGMAKSTTREATPVIPAEDKTAVMKDFMPTVFDANGNRLPHDEKEVTTQYQRTTPTFSQSFALKGVSQTFGWFFPDRLRLAETSAYSSASLNQELTKYCLDANRKIAELEAKLKATSVAPEVDKQTALRNKIEEMKQRKVM